MRLFIVALLAVVAMIASCANPKDLVYQDVKNFHVITLSLQPEVSMDIQFFNPNTKGVTLKSANIDVYINDKLIGKTNLQGSFAVPAADTFLLPVKLKADLRSLFANAYSLLANRTVTVKLHGSVKAGKGVFVNIPIHYEGKQKLHVLEKFN
jgi:LEA14-like dessication related protein